MTVSAEPHISLQFVRSSTTKSMPEARSAKQRITIIPFVHGKVTRDGKLSEPDIYYILDKWLQRHPEVAGRERDISIARGRWTLPQGIKTELVRVSISASDDIAGYNPVTDLDLYEYYLADLQHSTENPDDTAKKHGGESQADVL